jgi:hypothetical protein
MINLITDDEQKIGNDANWWNRIQSELQSPQKVILEVTGVENEKFWEDKLLSLVAQSGHKIIKNKDQARYLIKLRLQLNKGVTQNVEGFINGRLHLNMTSFDLLKSSRVEGAIQKNVDLNGRTEEQLWQRAQDSFEEILEKNIHLLHI